MECINNFYTRAGKVHQELQRQAPQNSVGSWMVGNALNTAGRVTQAAYKAADGLKQTSVSAPRDQYMPSAHKCCNHNFFKQADALKAMAGKRDAATVRGKKITGAKNDAVVVMKKKKV